MLKRRTAEAPPTPPGLQAARPSPAAWMRAPGPPLPLPECTHLLEWAALCQRKTWDSPLLLHPGSQAASSSAPGPDMGALQKAPGGRKFNDEKVKS